MVILWLVNRPRIVRKQSVVGEIKTKHPFPPSSISVPTNIVPTLSPNNQSHPAPFTQTPHPIPPLSMSSPIPTRRTHPHHATPPRQRLPDRNLINPLLRLAYTAAFTMTGLAEYGPAVSRGQGQVVCCWGEGFEVGVFGDRGQGGG